MQTETLRSWVVNAVDDMKGQDVRVLDVTNLTSLTDCFVIVTGNSSRHVFAMAQSVEEQARALGIHCQIEGKNGSEWILLDLGDLVLHVMTQEMRDYYCLEKLWTSMTTETLEAAVA